MRKAFTLVMAAVCVLCATIFSTPKAKTTGGVKAFVFLVSPSSGLNFASAFVQFSGNTSAVDVFYRIERYSGKDYKVLDKMIGGKTFPVLKSDYSKSWSLSGDGANSMTSEVSYTSANEKQHDYVEKTF